MQGSPTTARPRIQCFTTAYNGTANVLQNQVHISAAFDPSTLTVPLSPQARSAKEYSAIWDTGATNTVISPNVVQQCGLKPTSMTMVHTAGGDRMSPVYLISLFLPNQVCFPQLRATEAVLRDADVLIGMDVIGKGDFAVTNKDGRTVFSYRHPSVETIDFVKPTQTLRHQPLPKVGRNDPCPCGSGKKYKKCHGQ